MADYFSSIDDPVVYTAQGSGFHCSELIAMRGGWQNISAEESIELNRLGCYPGPIEVGDQYYTAPDFGAASGGSYDAAYEPTPQGGGASVPPPITNAPISQPDEVFSMPNMNIDPIMNFISTIPMQTGGLWTAAQIGGTIGGLLEQASKMIPFNQQDQIEAGITARGAASCWDRAARTGRSNRRMRVKLQRMPDGSLQVVRYCAKPRMNPLNPNALRRAAVRLGRFHMIASTIEKMVQKACRKGIGRGRIRSTPSCAPRKRCR